MTNKTDVYGKQITDDVNYFEINWDIIPERKVYDYLGLDFKYRNIGDLKYNLRALGVRYTVIYGGK